MTPAATTTAAAAAGGWSQFAEIRWLSGSGGAGRQRHHALEVAAVTGWTGESRATSNQEFEASATAGAKVLVDGHRGTLVWCME